MPGILLIAFHTSSLVTYNFIRNVLLFLSYRWGNWCSNVVIRQGHSATNQETWGLSLRLSEPLLWSFTITLVFLIEWVHGDLFLTREAHIFPSHFKANTFLALNSLDLDFSQISPFKEIYSLDLNPVKMTKSHVPQTPCLITPNEWPFQTCGSRHLAVSFLRLLPEIRVPKVCTHVFPVNFCPFWKLHSVLLY